MIYKLIVLQFIAHLLADYLFQPQRWCDIKESKGITRHHFYHALVVFVSSYLLSLNVDFWIGALAITLLHLALDLLKSKLQLKNPEKNYFFLDQTIHIMVFVGVVIAYNQYIGIDFIIPVDLRATVIVAGFIFCTKPANILIKYIFIAFSINSPLNLAPSDKIVQPSEKKPVEKSLPNAGKLIGIIERLLALALILSGEFSAVGLIIAAKSILRFNDTQKTEYVLVGTLISFGLAVIIGILIRMV